MLKGLVRALVLAHPPQKLESSQPDARDLAVLHGTFQLLLLQGADRIEYQSEAEDAETDQDPIKEYQGLHDSDGILLLIALYVLPENPQGAQNIPSNLRQQHQYPAEIINAYLTRALLSNNETNRSQSYA